MKTIPVRLKIDPYDIVVGNGILSKLGGRLKSLDIGTNAVIITNPAVKKHHGKVLISGLERDGFSVKVLEVPAGERSKSAKSAFRLMEQIARYDQLKKIFIIAFGGGVVGDLAGYVAAAYKRGVPYVQVPTTLLAQVDSAIGGKVAVDLPFGKNLAGAFYQPKVVWSDTATLTTLPQRQIRNGLAEIVKYGVIADKEFFQYVAGNYKKLLDCDPRALEHVVWHSSRIKRDVVVADERETKGLRSILNFGHTIGHAIEAAGKYNHYHHGEAIALGMRVAADISCQKKMCPKHDVESLNEILSRIGLPQRIEGVKTSDILRFMRHDKKFLAGRNRFVLMARLGKVRLVEGVSPDMIHRAVRSCQ
ncbi:MAG TPA: 3-dehydroquinate synthase [Candidatus Omnitrophota bacterium]|nr:3-dehydroquinate synthase [Candidatus Omnitrophota bacterium]